MPSWKILCSAKIPGAFQDLILNISQNCITLLKDTRITLSMIMVIGLFRLMKSLSSSILMIPINRTLLAFWYCCFLELRMLTIMS